MTAILLDSGVETAADLVGLLPQDLAARLQPEVLTEPPTAAALRVLATISDEHWHDHVGQFRIDWGGLLAWSRRDASPSVRVRVELAASLDGVRDARASLLAGATALDEGGFAALLDALRIARRGLEP